MGRRGRGVGQVRRASVARRRRGWAVRTDFRAWPRDVDGGLVILFALLLFAVSVSHGIVVIFD